MKVPPIPLSSPGRTDDFPPPLMRFPRSKSNRRSRSRSRANPMFVRKINTVIDASQEPSSPKVTCIGQVRVKRSKNKQTTTSGTTGVCRCRWIRKLRPRWFLCVCRINLSFFRCDCFRKSENLPVARRTEANERSEYLNREIGDVIRPDNKILLTESPPRNALLLTRSRSAPYRSSSLASKFWESTMENREDDERGKKVAGNTGVMEGACEGIIEKGNREEQEGSINGVGNLSRSKSEPSRSGEKLFTSFISS